ncbi:MAG: regulator, partial [Bacteroidota bacterium]|nr:regulator [Bacteroidota bacterium]
MNARILICVIILLFARIGASQWIQTNGPYGGYVDCLATIDSSIFIGTEAGVYRSIDSGLTWAHTGLRNVYITAFALDGKRIFAGTIGDIYQSIDDGKSWVS